MTKAAPSAGAASFVRRPFRPLRICVAVPRPRDEFLAKAGKVIAEDFGTGFQAFTNGADRDSGRSAADEARVHAIMRVRRSDSLKSVLERITTLV